MIQWIIDFMGSRTKKSYILVLEIVIVAAGLIWLGYFLGPQIKLVSDKSSNPQLAPSQTPVGASTSPVSSRVTEGGGVVGNQPISTQSSGQSAQSAQTSQVPLSESNPALYAIVKAANPTITIADAPATVQAGKLFDLSWRIDTNRELVVADMGMVYGPANVSNPPDSKAYTIAAIPQCSNRPFKNMSCSTSVPTRTYSSQVSIASPGTYYYRVKASFYGLEVWSDEKTITVTPPVEPIKQVALSAGPSAVYSGDKITPSVSVGGGTLEINFSVPNSTEFTLNSGVDFRGCGQNISVLPGGSGIMRVSPSTSCIITLYKHNYTVLGGQATIAGLQVLP